MQVSHLTRKNGMAWLEEVHGVPKGHECAVLYGNEDDPDKVLLYAYNDASCIPLLLVRNEQGKLSEQLHGVNVADFVTLFRKKRKDLYLKDDNGYGRTIAELTRWSDGWIAQTWPDTDHNERMKWWHELLAFVEDAPTK